MSFSPKFSDDLDSDEPVLDPRQANSRKRKSNDDDDQATKTTPGPSPIPSGTAPDYPQMEVDLPPELLERGLRKYWSRRESRPYYFNVETGATVWNQPEILPEPGKTGASGHVKKLRQKVII